jgi:hypothetical protein
MKDILKFLSDYLLFLGAVVLFVLAIVAVGKSVDSIIPCSSFSDEQELCGNK